MRLVVTGASGFVGKNVVEFLLKKGHIIIGIARSQMLIKHHNFEYRCIDITKKEDVNNFFENVGECDGVIHLAANISIPGDRDTLKNNYYGTYYVAKCAYENGIGKFVHLSSVPVIGVPIEIPITESHPVNPRTQYHLSKYISESVVKKVYKDRQYLNLRVCSPLGPGIKGGFVKYVLNKCDRDEDVELFGKGLRVQNYIDIRDVVQALENGLMSGRSGMYLIPGAIEISNYKLVMECKGLLESKSQIVLDKVADTEENMKWIIDGKKAKEELGYIPRYTLKDTVEWIMEARTNEDNSIF